MNKPMLKASRAAASPPIRGAVAAAVVVLGCFPLEATAADAPQGGSVTSAAPTSAPPPPPAPLGVFGADMPKAGKTVLSIIPQFSNMSTLLQGSSVVSPAQVVATTPWYYDPTKTLRGVPQNTFIATQTVALAYGVTSNLAVIVTVGMIEKNLDFLTFKGPKGITPLGFSYTGTSGISDSTASVIYRLYQDPIHRVQFNLGMSFPSGSTHATFNLLQPDGTYATTRAFYAMQIGSGTFDVMPGVVYAGHLDKWSWGASYRARLPLAANPEGYLWGNLHEFNGWGGYTVIPGVTGTLRVSASLQGQIRGHDPLIYGKAPAGNPNFYGGQRVELFGGASISGKFVGMDNMSVAIEGGPTVYQNLNGPQLSKNWQAGMALRFKL
jgi:hypothetical protein